MIQVAPPPPEIIRFESQDKLEDYLIQDIREQLHRSEYRRSEIGILYDDKIYGADHFKYEGKESTARMVQKAGDSRHPH